MGAWQFPPAWLVEYLEAVRSLGGWAISAMRIVGILIAAWLAIAFLQRVLRAFRQRLQDRLDDRESIQRAETLGRVGRYTVTVVVSALAFMLVLAEIGLSLAPILGAAGVVGVAVGFGAQSLVKDFFSGFFLLLENQIRVGDIVTAGGHSGLVEEITLRYVRLRDYDGNVHFVPNGRIEDVVNMTRGFAFAVVDIGVAYRENVDRVTAIMREVAAGMQHAEGFRERILADFELAGVERWDDSAVVIRGRFRVVPLAQWDVKREYLRRLKAAFDEAGVEIPFPQRTLHLPELAKLDALRESQHDQRADHPRVVDREPGGAGPPQPAPPRVAGVSQTP